MRNRRGDTALSHILMAALILMVAMRSAYAEEEKFRANNKAESAGSEYAIDLERALGIAITNNFDLKVIKAQKGIQDLIIRESWRDFFPTLTLSYLQTEEKRKRDTDSRQHKFGIDSNITVFDGGRRSLAYDAARLKSILARNDYRIALNNFIDGVSKAYFQILQSREAVKIHARTLENSAMQLTFIKKELELGDATKLDALAIEAKVKEVELNLEKARDQYVQTLNRFKLLLRVDRRMPLEVTGDIERDFVFRPPGNQIDEDLLVSLALKNRKEVESTDLEYLIAKTSWRISERYYYPKLGFGLNYSQTDDDFFPREKGWGVNVQISSMLWGNSGTINAGYTESGNGNSKALSNSDSLNILDSLSYRRSILESTINYKSAGEKKKTIRQQIALEVSALASALGNSWKMIEIAKKQLELYDSFLEIERLKANMGESRRYDLVKKELERGEAAISHLNSLVSYLVASSSLELAAGVDIGFFKLTGMKSRRNHE
jgi:outer membrane protein